MKDLELHQLCKRFGEQQVFENFSARFPCGQITCLMAPSGTGKTTLFRLILGLEDADAGEILGADCPLAAVFQEDRLFECHSALANIAAVLPNKPNHMAIAAALRALGIQGDLKLPVSTFSGGMKRRVAFARALLAPAELVLLDEPFTGLDRDSRRLALDFLRQQAVGKTILLATHEPEDAAYLGANLLPLVPKGPA